MTDNMTPELTLDPNTAAAAETVPQLTLTPEAPEPPKVEEKKADEKKAAAITGHTVNAPLPGRVIDIKVKVGDEVKAGQEVAVLEAMKMENNIDAERGGVVKSIHVQKGATVMEGDLLIVIE